MVDFSLGLVAVSSFFSADVYRDASATGTALVSAGAYLGASAADSALAPVVSFRIADVGVTVVAATTEYPIGVLQSLQRFPADFSFKARHRSHTQCVESSCLTRS